jgi:hypothetical protein
MRTPNYVLIQDYSFSEGQGWGQNQKTLPQGAFVRPISEDYVPKHILEKYSFYNKDLEIYCYTRYGIMLIPKKYLRET